MADKQEKKEKIRTSFVKEQLSMYRLQKEEEKAVNLKVYIGDVRKVLSIMPNECIDCVVTSPPYWKQRDYKHPKQIGREEEYIDYINILIEIFTELKRVLKPTGTFFLNIGYKYKNKELLLIPEILAYELQKNGWCLLNKIIWHKPNAMPSSVRSRFSNTYEPVFLFVKKESKYQYYLSLDPLRKPAKDFLENKKPEYLFGIQVRNALLKRGKPLKGVVTQVYTNYKEEIFAKISWENGKETIERANDFINESHIDIKLICKNCGKLIENQIEAIEHLNCSIFFTPLIPSKSELDEKMEIEPPSLFPLDMPERTYMGKYKASPENRGASPGVRLSLFGEYLVMQRRYRVYQPLIASYLRYWRAKSKITIKEIDRLFGYKDTAGHWFRMDTGSWGKGGSIPLPEDWFRLKEIMGFDDLYDKWLTKTHLVLQTVKPHPKGKNPGDLWSIKIHPFSDAHFAVFPEELVKKCIEAGCPKGGVVLDPFAGSGTTGKAALESGRKAILIELIPKYLNIIKKRCGKLEEVKYVE